MKHYTFKLKGDWATRNVWLNGKLLDPVPSQKISNHSPDGFAWGYGGSGPAQLALAICLELGIPPSKYQMLKWDIIAKITCQDFDDLFEFQYDELI